MILLSDGFDSYATGSLDTTDSLNGGNPGWGDFGQGLVIQATDGRFSLKSLRRPPNSGGAGFGGVVPFNWGTGQRAAGFWFKFSGGTTVTPIITKAGGSIVLLSVNPSTGSLVVKDGAGTTRITASTPLTSAVYAWVEVSYRTSFIELRIGNVSVGSYTGSYTDPGASVNLGYDVAVSTDTTWDLDDIIVWDNTGSFATFGIDPRRIQLLQPDGAGSSTDWTPNGPTNWESMTGDGWVAGIAPPVGVTGTAAGLKDLYTMSNLAVNSATIDAVTVRSLAGNSGGSPATLALVLKSSGGVEVDSTPQTITTSGQSNYEAVFYTDPSSAPWTATAINGLQAGVLSGV